MPLSMTLLQPSLTTFQGTQSLTSSSKAMMVAWWIRWSSCPTSPIHASPLLWSSHTPTQRIPWSPSAAHAQRRSKSTTVLIWLSPNSDPTSELKKQADLLAHESIWSIDQHQEGIRKLASFLHPLLHPIAPTFSDSPDLQTLSQNSPPESWNKKRVSTRTSAKANRW